MTPDTIPTDGDRRQLLELQLQRCADGELSDAEERSLLARLETDSDCWRRLALLFVEARLWRTACRRECDASRSSLDVDVTKVSPVMAMRSRQLLSLSAVCLVGLIAFGMGRWSSTSGQSAPQAARLERAEDYAAGPRATAAEGAGPKAVNAGAAQRQAAPTPALYVEVSLPGADRAVKVPVYSVPESAEAWRPFADPALSPAESEALRQAGFAVESQRQVLQVLSGDGREILLPMEAVNIQMARY